MLINKKTGRGFVIFWSIYKGEARIFRIVLAEKCKLFPESVIASSAEIEKFSRQIAAFLKGKKVRFDLKILRWDLCSVFQKKVLRAVNAIPRGKTSTYRQIARLIASPKSARAVGMALAGNPFPLVIPCHRVVRSDLKPGGYQYGTKMKSYLLRKESPS